MIYQNNRVAVCDQIFHDAGQSGNVGRMKANGRLVKYIEYARGTVPDGAGQLHPLTFSCGEGRSGPVKRQISKSQIQQPSGGVPKGLADALSHRPHLFRKRCRDGFHPFCQAGKRHPAGLIQRDSLQLWSTGRIGKAGASAIWTGVLLQKFLYPFHPLLVFYLGQGILHRINCIEKCKVQLCSLVRAFRILRTVENVLFLRGAVVDDILFLLCQIPEGYIGTDAHGPADVCHQRPHKRVPWSNSALINGQRVVRYKRVSVYRAHDPGSVTGSTGTLTVKCQLLCRRSIEFHAAFRADQRPLCGNGKCGGQIVTVWASVAGQPGIHKTQDVEQLGSGAEGAADTRNTRALPKRQCSRDIEYLIRLSFCSLCHTTSGIGGECFQITAGALRVQNSEGQRRLPGAGYTGDADDLVQGNINVYIFQIVHTCAADFDFIDHEQILLLFH